MKWEMVLLVDGVSVHNGTAVVDGNGKASLLRLQFRLYLEASSWKCRRFDVNARGGAPLIGLG